MVASSFVDSPFILESPFQPAGDQPQAIEQIVANLRANQTHQTLLDLYYGFGDRSIWSPHLSAGT
jgi:excinuclease UvrABC helicase subunit UvrB